MPEYYEIKVKGHLDPYWSEWFKGLQMTLIEPDETLLTGQLTDQAALHSLLERIRDLNLTITSMNRKIPPNFPTKIEPKGDQNGKEQQR